MVRATRVPVGIDAGQIAVPWRRFSRSSDIVEVSFAGIGKELLLQIAAMSTDIAQTQGSLLGEFTLKT